MYLIENGVWCNHIEIIWEVWSCSSVLTVFDIKLKTRLRNGTWEITIVFVVVVFNFFLTSFPPDVITVVVGVFCSAGSLLLLIWYYWNVLFWNVVLLFYVIVVDTVVTFFGVVPVLLHWYLNFLDPLLLPLIVECPVSLLSIEVMKYVSASSLEPYLGYCSHYFSS